ncbi:MAG: CDP-alcohol phosphatidyltransferase family protein [Rhodobacteraceae bacterium]|nr:CDP-alcohol phosphatidyltransferase family protein [Paracoccaceae bacterium]
MLDARIRPLIDPPLNALGRRLANAGVSADAVTWAGFIWGIAGCAMAAIGWFTGALCLILISRLADGLDGAVARATRKTDRGGFLDIVLDFIFYGAAPLAFAIYDPANNALAAAVLLLTYFANGSAFLAYAIMAAKRGEETAAQGEKSLYYLSGLAEGFETILVTCIWCLFPSWFAPLAYLYAGVVGLSAGARIAQAAQSLD